MKKISVVFKNFKWEMFLITFLIVLFAVNSCGQEKYISANLIDRAQTTSVQELDNGIVISAEVEGVTYKIEILEKDQTQSLRIFNEDGKTGLLAATDLNNNESSGNLFVLFENSGFEMTALNLANQNFLRNILSKNGDSNNIQLESYLRMLPKEDSEGGIIVITDSNDAIVVYMDNNPAGTGGGGGCGGSPDSMSNACRAALNDYKDCMESLDPNKDCNDAKGEARLRCMMETNNNIGVFH